MPRLSHRFEDALVLASQLHADQRRKGTDVPYVAHLLGVASLVLEDGGDEDEAIAALLHDAVEDQGGAPTLELIRARFGERVARIVAGCTDADTIPKPPWRARKERYLAHLAHADPDVRRVSSADKLHNARTILLEQRASGNRVFARFSGGLDGTLWYYRALVTAFRSAAAAAHEPQSRMTDELEGVVAEMERLARASGGTG